MGYTHTQSKIIKRETMDKYNSQTHTHHASPTACVFFYSDIYTLPCVKQIANGELLYKHRELSLVLCDDLKGGRPAAGAWWQDAQPRRRGYMYTLRLILIAAQQKPTQHRKTTILQKNK